VLAWTRGAGEENCLVFYIFWELGRALIDMTWLNAIGGHCLMKRKSSSMINMY